MLEFSSTKIKFSRRCGQLLKETRIKENSPGTILQDFSFLLNFIEERGCPLTNRHLLQLSLLPEINSGLSHPIKHGLRRPMQKSYPHINGLYLLARASGLTFVEETGKKQLLSFDNAAFQTWKTLNHTERYCTLLETWFLRGYPEIIGERGGAFFQDSFLQCVKLFEAIPENGLQVAGSSEAEDLLRYRPGWHNLGLLELFGLISVRHGLPVEGKGWNIEDIYRTPFGDALVALLFTKFFGKLEHLCRSWDGREPPFGVLQPVLQPYFVDWKNNLSVSEPVFREGVHIFKVSLGKVWYRIAIPADRTVDDLALAILEAVDFDAEHLYEFSYKNRFGVLGHVNHPYMDDGPWASEMLVGDLQLQVGQKMIFLFDFGDSWKFDIVLEQVDREMDIEEPEILELHGEPPEQYPEWDDE